MFLCDEKLVYVLVKDFRQYHDVLHLVVLLDLIFFEYLSCFVQLLLHVALFVLDVWVAEVVV